ncbi:hypothetical protein OPV22_012410 [Ensete ventricosum]|uniref:Glycosyltransferase family 28 N-terminal domain-containing protein n=1 Tax=Ensete ventricosum TaxID=4639 RepID=A0AAV8PH22_ENSVE|nr:hypothetical protein OPV22_012410 [Ensete ventricosum]
MASKGVVATRSSASHRRGDAEDTTFKFTRPIPKLKIAMLVVGTRGDVQPFIAFAKKLQASMLTELYNTTLAFAEPTCLLQEFGHCVRLATHVNFRTFVKSCGLEFYPLGGDPQIMVGCVARNKGFLLLDPEEINVQRKQLKEIIDSLLPACTGPHLDSGMPFRAQAIIANPPAYGHLHVAEALGVPLHIFFTMPWTPTNEFPHPFARVPQSAAYRLSYLIVDLIVWWGIRGFINDLRKGKLKLPPIAYFSTYHGSISHFPIGYMWSAHLVPKPSVLYTTDAVSEVPVDVYLLGDCPHDWLFPQCSAVVHHGGAGTTASGLRAGCPTTVVPFFGDQHFWGERIRAVGVGPAPIPISDLSVERLSNAIRFMLQPEVKLRAMELREQIDNEDGVAAAVDAFHRHLPPQLPIPPPPPPPDDGPTNPIQWLPQFVFHALHGPPFTHRLIVLAILYYILIVIFLCVNMGY